MRGRKTAEKVWKKSLWIQMTRRVDRYFSVFFSYSVIENFIRGNKTSIRHAKREYYINYFSHTKKACWTLCSDVVQDFQVCRARRIANEQKDDSLPRQTTSLRADRINFS